MTKPAKRSVFAAPLLIGIASVVGLVSALLGDGLLDSISWAALTVPVVVIVWAVKRRRR